MLSKTDASEAADASRFQLRRLKAEDIPLLEELEALTSLTFWGADNYRRFLDELSEYFAFGIFRVLDMKLDAELDMKLATESVRLTGFSLARAVFEDMELLKIGVRPEFQRLGFGTRLLTATLAEGQNRGGARCFLEVRKSNQKALQFYASHHFHIAGARHNYYSNPVEDAWIMECQLS